MQMRALAAAAEEIENARLVGREPDRDFEICEARDEARRKRIFDGLLRAILRGLDVCGVRAGGGHACTVTRLGARSARPLRETAVEIARPRSYLELDLEADPAAGAPALAAVDRMVVEGRPVEADGLVDRRIEAHVDLAPRPSERSVQRDGVQSIERCEGRGRRAVEEVVPDVDAAPERHGKREAVEPAERDIGEFRPNPSAEVVCAPEAGSAEK